jgi:hypothetical protein
MRVAALRPFQPPLQSEFGLGVGEGSPPPDGPFTPRNSLQILIQL